MSVEGRLPAFDLVTSGAARIRFEREWRQVKAPGHAAEVLEAVGTGE
jgi:hypothetical protein